MRESRAAGNFYPKNKQELIKQLERLGLNKTPGKSRIIIAPHAGIQFSGRTVAKAHNQATKAQKVVVIGTNHSGTPGVHASQQDWMTPLGRVEAWKTKKFRISEGEHAAEHSVEVQLPFQQYRLKEFKVLPLVASGLDYEECERTAKKIVALNPDLLVASGDMTHAGPRFGDAENYDPEALEYLEEGDAKGFHAFTKTSTVCGRSPFTTALILAEKMGLKPRLLDYSTSKDVAPSPSWVGYAAMIFE